MTPTVNWDLIVALFCCLNAASVMFCYIVSRRLAGVVMPVLPLVLAMGAAVGSLAAGIYANTFGVLLLPLAFLAYGSNLLAIYLLRSVRPFVK